MKSVTPRVRDYVKTPARGYAVRCAVAAPPHRTVYLMIQGLRPMEIGGIAPEFVNSSRKATALPHIGRQSRKPEISQSLGSGWVLNAESRIQQSNPFRQRALSRKAHPPATGRWY
jgi:hypothetical protein